MYTEILLHKIPDCVGTQTTYEYVCRYMYLYTCVCTCIIAL